MKMLGTAVDSRARITIGSEIVKKYGKRFFVVQAPDEVVLIPVPKDPIKDLMEWGKKAGFHGMTSKQIRRMAEEQAYAEIDEELAEKEVKRRIHAIR